MILSIPLFIIEWLIGVFLALVAILFAEVIALFVNKDGNLPWGLRHVFQPSDNPCWGDASWIAEHPAYSKWRLSASYLRRNAAYGYQSLVAYPIPKTTKVYGDTSINDGDNGKAGWFFILGNNGAFEFCWILNLRNGSCLRGEYGWALRSTALGYNSPLAGSLQLVFFLRRMSFK